MATRRMHRASTSGSRRTEAQHVGRGRKGDTVRAKLLELLVTHSYNRADYEKYELSSGKWSNFYIDCKTTTMLAEAGPLIGEACAGFIPKDAEAVGGLTLGADPIAHAISSYLWYKKGRRLDLFSVRKTPKKHGLQHFIEGSPGKRVVIVDDVVTTGGSTIEAIRRCREERISVVGIVVLVDREESGGMDEVRRHAGPGVPVKSIFKKSDLEAVWQARQTRYGSAVSASRRCEDSCHLKAN
jgi:orotate phosphoribosyltransferase